MKNSFFSTSVFCEKAVDKVGAKIYANSNADDDDIHAGDVNGQTPPVHIATHIEAAEKYTHHDKHWSSPTAQGDQGCDKYAS